MAHTGIPLHSTTGGKTKAPKRVSESLLFESMSTVVMSSSVVAKRLNSAEAAVNPMATNRTVVITSDVEIAKDSLTSVFFSLSHDGRVSTKAKLNMTFPKRLCRQSVPSPKAGGLPVRSPSCPVK
mmetsp:Transcript_69736/g.140314  ORF Transcript_69736/g.140314 Transcript_69736/m.140314 type:complete len:125 (-) Transcript_69736:750-1124(-)